ncbi:hypothetical protein [Microbacterium arborescens]|uniref:DUF7882 family protein n=1 Tax=Microbacterium arborescens TaxID=33883 RepID=UPI003C731E4A
MGSMFYSNTPDPVEFPDTLLAHLQAVIGTKLRRNESFTLSWQHSDDDPNGRTTLWIHPAMPLRFTFDRRDLDPLDPELLHKLAAEASSTAGITIDQALIEAHQAA